MLKRRRVSIACVQETMWKGAKAKEIGEGYKMSQLYEHREQIVRNIKPEEEILIGADLNVRNHRSNCVGSNIGARLPKVI